MAQWLIDDVSLFDVQGLQMAPAPPAQERLQMASSLPAVGHSYLKDPADSDFCFIAFSTAVRSVSDDVWGGLSCATLH
jgi:hypothetical protein